MSTLIPYRDIKWPNYMNYEWTSWGVSISFSRSRQRPLHMTIHFTFCILINLIQTPSSSPSHLPTLENLWTIQEKRTTTLNITSMNWLLSELWRHDRQGLLCILVTSPVFQHPMLRQDVHFAERNFSEICCITEVEKAAEMYSYSSKRVNIILIQTLDVQND